MDFNNLWSGFDLSSQKRNTRCLPVNTILAGKYLVGPVLGQGGFGITYVGYDLNMEIKIAIKEYFPVELVSRDTTTMHGDRVLSLSGEKSITYKQGLKKYVAEAQNVSQFSEVPGVVSVKDFFYENETAYIVMEYIDGISLKEYLKEKGGRLSEEETLMIMKPVLEALEQVHKAGIIHRDISPDNIMLTFSDKVGDNAGIVGSNTVSEAVGSGNPKIHSVKLIDFGAARMTAKNDQKSLTIILKHGYAPEEQYRTQGEQGTWTDVYALCAVLYRMLTGETPVPAMDRMFQDVLKPFENFNMKVSVNTAAAIMKGLAVKKEDRIQTVRELISALYEGEKIATVGKQKTPAVMIGICVACVAVGIGLAVGGVTMYRMRQSASDKGDGLNAIEDETIFFTATEADSTIEEIIGETESSSSAKDEGNLSAGENSGEEVLVMEETEEELGPQIVWPRAETMVAGGFGHVVSLRDDGTVLAAGDNLRGQCETAKWENIAAVYAGDYISIGLKTDGTVVTAGRMTKATKSEGDISYWSGIIDMAASNTHILGLTQDGHVVSAGSGDSGCCDTGEWENIVDIWVDDDISFGVDQDGNLFTAGILSGQEEVLEQVREWKDIVDICVYGTSGNYDVWGVKADGSVVVAGDVNERWKDIYTEWSQIVAIECGNSFVAALKADGTLQKLSDQSRELGNWENVAALTSTMNEAVGLQKDGRIIMTEPVMAGNSSLEEILTMDNLKESGWSFDCLYVLEESGTIKMTGYVSDSSDEGMEEGTWTGVASLATSHNGIAALTDDKRVMMIEDQGLSYDYDDSLELSMKEQADLAWEHKEQTPVLWKDWTNVKMVARSDEHIVAVLENGEVRAAGVPMYQREGGTDYKTGLTYNGSCDVSEWTDIKQVVAYRDLTVGLKEDGTLVTAGETTKDWTVYSDIDSIWGGSTVGIFAITKEGKAVQLLGSTGFGQGNTATWDNLTQIALSMQHTVGLREDGTVVAVGSNFCGQCDVETWTDVVHVSAGQTSTTAITSDGRILIAGTLPGDIWVAEEWQAIDMSVFTEE